MDGLAWIFYEVNEFGREKTEPFVKATTTPLKLKMKVENVSVNEVENGKVRERKKVKAQRESQGWDIHRDVFKKYKGV